MHGTFWTVTETEILKEIWHLDGPLEMHMHRLPGRGVDATVLRAARLKLGRRFIEWTPEEDAILREIWPNSSVKSQLHRLPKRKWKAVLNRAIVLGLPARAASVFVSSYSWIDDAAHRELESAAPMNVHQIAKRIGASPGRVGKVLRRDSNDHFRIVDWDRISANGAGAWTPIWSIGSEPDVEQPRRSNAERMREYRAKRRIAAGQFNPFATALGMVAAPQGTQGRVYKQDMVIHLHDELEAA